MLSLHRGSSPATWEQVCAAETPEATKTWQPVAHKELIELVTGSLEMRGFKVTEQRYGLRAEGKHLFGVLEVEHVGDLFPVKLDGPTTAYSLMVAVRNSHDKSMGARLGLGSRVWVCDNMAFSAEVLLARKHTPRILEVLEELIGAAVGKLIGLAKVQDEDFTTFQRLEIGNRQADAILTECVRRGALPSRVFETALGQWDKPNHEEFQPRTTWSLYNAVTHALKTTAFPELGKRTETLHAILKEISAARRN